MRHLDEQTKRHNFKWSQFFFITLERLKGPLIVYFYARQAAVQIQQEITRAHVSLRQWFSVFPGCYRTTQCDANMMQSWWDPRHVKLMHTEIKPCFFNIFFQYGLFPPAAHFSPERPVYSLSTLRSEVTAVPAHRSVSWQQLPYAPRSAAPPI